MIPLLALILLSAIVSTTLMFNLRNKLSNRMLVWFIIFFNAPLMLGYLILTI